MKRFLVVLLAVVAAAGLARVYYMKSVVAARYSLAGLQKQAIEANKALPVMVDPQTRLDAVVASSGLLEKRYTLVSADASSELSNMLSTRLFPVLKEQACQNEYSMDLYRNGVGEAFTYADRRGRHIGTFTIDKSSCSS